MEYLSDGEDNDIYEGYLDDVFASSDEEPSTEDNDNTVLRDPLCVRHIRADRDVILEPESMEFIDCNQAVEPSQPASGSGKNNRGRKSKPSNPPKPSKKPKREYYGWHAGIFESKELCDRSDCQPSMILAPLQYFMRYFDSNFFENAAKYTNDYALLKYGEILNITATEIRHCIGLLLYIGLTQYPRLSMYWENDFSHDVVTRTMTRDRFHSIRNRLHFSDEGQHYDANNKLWKMQPFLDMIQRRMDQIERRQQWCYSVDEQMISFTGRCPKDTKQTVKNKPRPTGFRNYCLSTSFGLVLRFIVYQGRSTVLNQAVPGVEPSVVNTLTIDLRPGSFLFFDRFFTTITLLQHLRNRNINATGTIMKNRFGSCPFIKSATKMFRGEIEEYLDKDEKVVLIRWKDSRDVLLASNCLGGSPTGVVQRRQKQGGVIDVTAPACVMKYNQKMGGVDIADQLLEYYRCFYRTTKWTVKMTVHFIELICANSYMEMKNDLEEAEVKKPGINSFFKFRRAVAMRLIDGAELNDINEADMGEMAAVHQLPRKHYRLPEIDKRFDMLNHWPKVDKIKDAQRCRQEECKGKSRTMCMKCQVFLCLNSERNCFYDFHNSVEQVEVGD